MALESEGRRLIPAYSRAYVNMACRIRVKLDSRQIVSLVPERDSTHFLHYGANPAQTKLRARPIVHGNGPMGFFGAYFVLESYTQ